MMMLPPNLFLRHYLSMNPTFERNLSNFSSAAYSRIFALFVSGIKPIGVLTKELLTSVIASFKYFFITWPNTKSSSPPFIRNSSVSTLVFSPSDCFLQRFAERMKTWFHRLCLPSLLQNGCIGSIQCRHAGGRNGTDCLLHHRRHFVKSHVAANDDGDIHNDSSPI